MRGAEFQGHQPPAERLRGAGRGLPMYLVLQDRPERSHSRGRGKPHTHIHENIYLCSVYMSSNACIAECRGALPDLRVLRGAHAPRPLTQPQDRRLRLAGVQSNAEKGRYLRIIGFFFPLSLRRSFVETYIYIYISSSCFLRVWLIPTKFSDVPATLFSIKY